MKRNVMKRFAALAFLACLFSFAAIAQEQPATPATHDAEQTASEPNANDANAGIGEILAHTTEKAAHTAEQWGNKLGLGPKASFSVSIGFNFLALFIFCYVLMKSKVPQAFRERTLAIQKGIRDAQEASAEATKRLTDIEARLAKLDVEVSAIRAAAERDAAAEEARIKQAAEEDKKKIVEAAESEIDAFARNARRELKSYAASLAVDLAARDLRIDDNTDHALIREFASQLGKDGK
jgi:F-type H+-transporting ATPase subunit b